jgi:hypothetical protein
MQVYAVMGQSGEYSDHSEWIICVCVQETTAKKLVKDLTELQEFDNAFVERRRKEFDDVYRDPPMPMARPQQPKPRSESKTRKSLRGSGMQKDAIEKILLTSQKKQADRMRAWEQNMEAYVRLVNEMHWKKEAARKEWVATNYNPPPHLQEAVRLTDRELDHAFPSYKRDADYSYYDIELIED